MGESSSRRRAVAGMEIQAATLTTTSTILPNGQALGNLAAS
jgi:hypothetical protein